MSPTNPVPKHMPEAIRPSTSEKRNAATPGLFRLENSANTPISVTNRPTSLLCFMSSTSGTITAEFHMTDVLTRLAALNALLGHYPVALPVKEPVKMGSLNTAPSTYLVWINDTQA